MNLISIAIGEKYEIEAKRLQKSLKESVYVFTKQDEKYKTINEDSLIDGLYHKSNFANYFQDLEGPVIFMDADMFTLMENPFETFSVKEDTDFAYVPYKGKWHFPDTIRQEAFNYHGHKINSGFMYFKNLEIAQIICTKWAEEFLKRPLHWIKNEYDEYALMIALMKLDVKKHLLDKKWNDWELNTEEEIKGSYSVFFQSHDFLDILNIKNK